MTELPLEQKILYLERRLVAVEEQRNTACTEAAHWRSIAEVNAAVAQKAGADLEELKAKREDKPAKPVDDPE